MAASPRWASRTYLKQDDLQDPKMSVLFISKLSFLNDLTQEWDPLMSQFIKHEFDEYQRVLDKPGTFLMEELLGIEVDIEQSPFQQEKKIQCLKTVAKIKQRAKVMSEEEAKKPLDSGAKINQEVSWQESQDWAALHKELMLQMSTAPHLPWMPPSEGYKEKQTFTKEEKKFLRWRKLTKQPKFQIPKQNN